MTKELMENLPFWNGILFGLVNRFNQKELKQPVYPNGSCAYWIIGHLARGRKSMLELLERPVENEKWVDTFTRGSKGQYHHSWPDITLLKKFMENSKHQICKKLEHEGDILEKAAKSFLSDKMATVGENLLFLLFHEIYHTGQIGMAANLFGHGPIAK